VSGVEARLQRPEQPLLFEKLPQILKHGVFFVRTRATGDEELQVQVQGRKRVRAK